MNILHSPCNLSSTLLQSLYNTPTNIHYPSIHTNKYTYKKKEEEILQKKKKKFASIIFYLLNLFRMI